MYRDSYGYFFSSGGDDPAEVFASAIPQVHIAFRGEENNGGDDRVVGLLPAREPCSSRTAVTIVF
jgi:hypothetical protein